MLSIGRSLLSVREVSISSIESGYVDSFIDGNENFLIISEISLIIQKHTFDFWALITDHPFCVMCDRINSLRLMMNKQIAAKLEYKNSHGPEESTSYQRESNYFESIRCRYTSGIIWIIVDHTHQHQVGPIICWSVKAANAISQYGSTNTLLPIGFWFARVQLRWEAIESYFGLTIKRCK